MPRVFALLVFLFALSTTMYAQGTYLVEGRVFSAEMKEPIPYANVYNVSLKQGTVSNADGYFKVAVSGPADTLTISAVGYNQYLLQAGLQSDFHTVHLEKNVLLLSEVTIRPGDDSHLYDLLNRVRKSRANDGRQAKALFELKSHHDGEQVELVESYYNMDMAGVQATDLHLKAGRLAVKPFHNSIFSSYETSKVFIMLDLFDAQGYFPVNPLALSRRKMKKQFYLSDEGSYRNSEGDSIRVIAYTPKDSSGVAFNGKLWIDIATAQLLKVTMVCKDAGKHPFVPLFGTDRISEVDLHITQTFKVFDGASYFHHTDFSYRLVYESRVIRDQVQEIDLGPEVQYEIHTDAVLYAYDHDSVFFEPLFRFSAPDIRDDLKIQAYPLNAFFWQHNDEYRLNDSLNTNALFYADTATLTEQQLYDPKETPWQFGSYKFPFIRWTGERIRFVNAPIEPSNQAYTAQIKSQQYNLDVKLFADLSTYNDSTDVLTATIFDPFDSYYHLPMDAQSMCFVNMYFDLCEIARRDLDSLLKAERQHPDKLRALYHTFVKEYEREMQEFLKAVERGTNQKAMLRYNDYIIAQLGIDNMGLFAQEE